MNIAEAKQQVKDTVDEYLTTDAAGAPIIPIQGQRPIFLLGAPGVGKTAIISQVAHELGIGLVSYSMTHHTRQSALGLPFIVHKQYGDCEFDVSEYTMSEIIASIYDYMEATGHSHGILFLDEVNCVSETLYPSMLQFLQFKTFGRHRVPEGWVVVCAGNPPEYNKSVFDFDVVTLDRLRKIAVEPDIDSWMHYAMSAGIHPAIMSYLDVKRDHFYVIESTPSGKSFVTARGWEDLSRVITLAEAKGRSIGKAHVEQFLQSDEIAERFAQYYALFTKYRSDYQVRSILDGTADEAVANRAKAARFDERLALVRLILDGLDSQLAHTLEAEASVATARDAIRRSKDVVLAGADVESTLGSQAQQILADAKHRVDLDMATDASVRSERLAATKLREYIGACQAARVIEGQAAFEVVRASYETDVSELQETVRISSAAITNAFAWLEATFGDDKEMSVFVAELSARKNTSQFIARFGNDAYYAHNGATLVEGSRNELLSRIDGINLSELEAAMETAKNAACGPGCGASCC